MPPKKPTTSSYLFLVVTSTGVDSVHASPESANTRVTAAKSEGKDAVKVEVQQLVGGDVVVHPVSKAESKGAGKSKGKGVKKEEESEDEAIEEEEDEKPAAKKTKSAAEQRAANAAKPKTAKGDENLPDNVKDLLHGNGDALEGLKIVVTGVPPKIGRKNAEKLVQLYGGHLVKSISRNTDRVVLGNDAGPKKLVQIDDLGVMTWDEDELIRTIESGGGSNGKGGAADDEDEEDEEKEVIPKPKKRKTKA